MHSPAFLNIIISIFNSEGILYIIEKFKSNYEENIVFRLQNTHNKGDEIRHFSKSLNIITVTDAKKVTQNNDARSF